MISKKMVIFICIVLMIFMNSCSNISNNFELSFENENDAIKYVLSEMDYNLLLSEKFNDETLLFLSNPLNQAIKIVSILKVNNSFFVKYSMTDFSCYSCHLEYELNNKVKIPILIGIIDDPEIKKVEINNDILLEVFSGYFIGINVLTDPNYSIKYIYY